MIVSDSPHSIKTATSAGLGITWNKLPLMGIKKIDTRFDT